MAVKHWLGGEDESYESTEQADLRNARKPENVDLLVSRFLNELSDLSSEMAQKEESIPGPPTKPEAVDNRSTTPSRVPDGVTSDPELEKINEEIEKALAELERLKAGSASPEDSKGPEIQAKPVAVDEIPPSATPVEPVKQSVSASHEPDWRRMELFRNSVSTRKPPRRFPLRWVLAGAVLVAALGIASYFAFFNAGEEAPARVVPEQSSEPAKPPQPPEGMETPAAKEPPAEPDVVPNKSKSASQAKTTAQESKRKPAPSQTRTAEANNGRKQETANAKQDLKRPAQNGNSGTLTEKPAAKAEISGTPPPQTTASIPNPVEQPAPAPNPPAIAPQPKQGSAGNNNAIEATVPLTAPVPEAPPAAPKPAAAATAEVSDNTPQAKPRTALSAEVLTRVPPIYPAIARAQRVSGKVEVEAEIDAKGNVVRAKAVSGPNLLRLSAEQALMQWKFKPASVEGVSVPSTAKISVTFNIQ